MGWRIPCTWFFKELAVIIVYLIVGCLYNKDGKMEYVRLEILPTLNPSEHYLSTRPYPKEGSGRSGRNLSVIWGLPDRDMNLLKLALLFSGILPWVKSNMSTLSSLGCYLEHMACNGCRFYIQAFPNLHLSPATQFAIFCCTRKWSWVIQKLMLLIK